MTLKTLALAGATLVSLAAPATVMAQPYDHRGGYDRDAWRRNEVRAYERIDHRGDYRDYRRCFTETRGGYYGWNGRYVPRVVEVCR
ncbi:hypothetical protein [Phenylobacterium sp.]|jgi:hypothetical protein|uniref:hypothetical protein n=1 Tax=Phenylobacterium sp. TaxID=1871053 RepID=UPI002F3E260C